MLLHILNKFKAKFLDIFKAILKGNLDIKGKFEKNLNFKAKIPKPVYSSTTKLIKRKGILKQKANIYILKHILTCMEKNKGGVETQTYQQGEKK